MKTYSTIEVARLLKITSGTLHRWIRENRIEAPPLQSLGGMQIRIWSEESVEKVRNYKTKRYRKGRGRKKKAKSKKK
jgi:excisionase family DNA binding protein